MATKSTKKTTTTPTEEVKKPTGKHNYANGKRKTSVARVKLHPGKGEIIVNEKTIDQYFSVKSRIGLIKSPLKLAGAEKSYDIVVVVFGGGEASQAEAIRHGISKALVISQPESKTTLKKAGLLTRDARVKERKKFGLKRARKAPQFSKR